MAWLGSLPNRKQRLLIGLMEPSVDDCDGSDGGANGAESLVELPLTIVNSFTPHKRKLQNSRLRTNHDDVHQRRVEQPLERFRDSTRQRPPLGAVERFLDWGTNLKTMRVSHLITIVNSEWRTSARLDSGSSVTTFSNGAYIARMAVTLDTTGSSAVTIAMRHSSQK